MDLSRLNNLCKMNIMREPSTNFPTQSSQNQRNVEVEHPPPIHHGRHGICLPPPLSHKDFLDIKRCFRRANAEVEGYLDCKELKVYMDLRRCPITQWEAEMLLEYSDPVYHYYISLDQIVELATLYGIGTPAPVRMTRSEFEIAVQHVFQISKIPYENQSEERMDFNRAVNYFESKAADERGEEFVPPVTIFQNQKNLSQKKSQNISQEYETIDSSSEWNEQENSNSKPSKKIQTKSATVILDETQETVNALKKKWEYKIKELHLKFNPTSNASRSSMPASDSNWIKVKNNQQQVDLSSNGSLEMKIRKSPQIQSIFKREKISKSSSTTDLQNVVKSFKSEAVDCFLETANAKTSTSSFDLLEDVTSSTDLEDDDKNIKQSIVAFENNSQRPQLPPPIIPDIPKEWKSDSSNKMLKSMMKGSNRRPILKSNNDGGLLKKTLQIRY